MGDGVEEVVVARVEHRVHHASGDTQHSTTAVLDLDVQGTVTGFGVLDLARVSSRDGSTGSIISARKVLGSSGVLGGRHGDELGDSSEQEDLGESKSRHVAESGETHTVLEDVSERVVSSQVEASIDVEIELLDHHTDEGSHGNAAVLDLDSTTTGEGLGILSKSEGIEEIERTGVNSEAIRGAGISEEGGGLADLRR